MTKKPTYSKSPRPAHAIAPIATAKPKRAQPGRPSSQSKDNREDRGTRQIKTTRP